MRRFIRRTLTLLVLSAVLFSRRSSGGTPSSGRPGGGRTRAGGTVTSHLRYAGQQWKLGRVRVLKQGRGKSTDRRPTKNDKGWANQPTRYQPQYGSLDKHGRATGIEVTMNWQVRENVKHKTGPDLDVPGMVPGQDQKGHLLGAQFGGSNHDPRNFVPLKKSVNSPDMRGIENQVKTHMYNNQGQDFTYKVTPVYGNPPPGNPVPSAVEMQLTDSSGNPVPLRDLNGNLVNVVTVPN
jgi:hypothetical protein